MAVQFFQYVVTKLNAAQRVCLYHPFQGDSTVRVCSLL